MRGATARDGGEGLYLPGARLHGKMIRERPQLARDGASRRSPRRSKRAEGRPEARHRDRPQALSAAGGGAHRRAHPPRRALLRPGDLAADRRFDEPVRARPRAPVAQGELRGRGMDTAEGQSGRSSPAPAAASARRSRTRLAQDGASVVIADLQNFDTAAAEIAQVDRRAHARPAGRRVERSATSSAWPPRR